MKWTLLLIAALSAGARGQLPFNGHLQIPAPDSRATTSDVQPRLEFDETEHDFGRVSDQIDLKHRFYFRNSGEAALNFPTELRMTGSGTYWPRSKDLDGNDKTSFLPGEGGFIELTLFTNAKKGAYVQRFTLHDNDPRFQPEGPVLVMRAHIRPSISFDPPAVSFGELRPGATATRMTKVTGSARDFDVPYLSVSKGRFIKARVTGREIVDYDGEPAGQVTLALTLDASGLDWGEFNSVGTVRTTDPDFSLADFPIAAKIVNDIHVLPSRLNVGVIHTGDQLSRTFRVLSRDGKPFHILRVYAAGDSASMFDAGFIPVEGEHVYQVIVRGTASSAGPIQASIVVETDHPDVPKVEVTLSGAVR